MSPDHYNDILLQISCTLSILGSLLVMFVCNSKQMILKQQKGKYLIFWLSFSDFASSSVYLFSSISLTDRDHRENSNKCQAFALLGIFFPVASFLWTDFIAYYLYSMIVSRKVKTESEWKLLMLYFHIISWGVSALCILIVASFEHAGSADTEAGDNTGGWCWVAASSNSLIFWEIIGGKFVEWLSAFIILPYFYWITARTLMSLDQSWTQMTERNKKRSNKSTIWDSLSTTTLSLRFSLQTYFHPEASPSVDPLLGTNDEEDDDDDDDDDEFTEGDSEKRGSFVSSGRQQTTDTTNSHAHERIKFHEPTKVDECHNTPKFRKFYAKMALVPILFFLARIWGSIRIIIYATNTSSGDANLAIHSANTWLKTMQAIFDTSQGFLNAIVFVFLSTENMTFLYETFCLSQFIKILCCGHRGDGDQEGGKGRWGQRPDTSDDEGGGRRRGGDGKSSDHPSKSNEEEDNGSSSYLPQLNHLRTKYFEDYDEDEYEEGETEEGGDEEKVIWDGGMSYQKTSTSIKSNGFQDPKSQSRSIKCSFTEDDTSNCY